MKLMEYNYDILAGKRNKYSDAGISLSFPKISKTITLLGPNTDLLCLWQLCVAPLGKLCKALFSWKTPRKGVK